MQHGKLWGQATTRHTVAHQVQISPAMIFYLYMMTMAGEIYFKCRPTASPVRDRSARNPLCN